MSVEAMLAAIRDGAPAEARRLLEQKPVLAKARDEQGVSLLMQALYHRQPEIAELIAGRHDQLDLHEAVSLGNIDRAAVLIEEDPDSIGQRSADGFTALHYAAFFGQPEAAKLLLRHCAEVSVAADNPMKVQPLHSAAANNANAICKSLLEAGADPDAQQHGGYTALMSAAMHGNEDLIRLLIEYDADLSIQSDDGKTALDFARDKGHEGVLPLLSAEAD